MPPHPYYTLFMVLAFAAFVFTRRLIPRPAALQRLPWQHRLALALAAFVGAALGAKLPFAFGSEVGVLDWRAWLGDGKTVTTGLVGAYLGVELCKFALGIDAKTGDSFALPLAVALAVGRWGCFCNGCCFGTPTGLPWGVDFGDGELRHPTQAYESAFHLLLAAVLVALLRYRVLRYQHLKLYLICYGVFRFLTEYVRPEPAALAGLTFYQLVALLMIAGLAVQWVWDERRKRREEAASLTGPEAVSGRLEPVSGPGVG